MKYELGEKLYNPLPKIFISMFRRTLKYILKI